MGKHPPAAAKETPRDAPPSRGERRSREAAARRGVDALIEFGEAVVQAGLLASTCGNVSPRIDEHYMAVSASGSELGALRPEDVSVIAYGNGRVLRGPRPSMEAGLHRRIYEVRPAAGAVLHCQSRAATLLACQEDPPRNLDFIPEIPAYVRAHVYVPYATPGSVELADSVASAFEDPEVTVVQMRNHGQVLIGAGWRETVRRGVFFELGCWMASQGARLRTIPADKAALLRSYARDV